MAKKAMPLEESGQDGVPPYLQEILGKFFEPMLEELSELKKAAWANSVLQKPVLTVDEACWYLGMSKSCLYKKTSRCEIPHFSPGRKILYFNRVDLEAYMLGGRRGTVAEIKAKGGKN